MAGTDMIVSVFDFLKDQGPLMDVFIQNWHNCDDDRRAFATIC